jgi:hypothetical protein
LKVITVGDTVKKMFWGIGNIFLYDIQQCMLNDEAYDKVLGKKD